MKLKLDNVTLIGVDCVNPARLAAVMDLCHEKFEFAETKLLSSIKINDERWVEISNISCLEEYSIFCLSKLVGHVKTDYALLVQWDGFILNPDSWSPEFAQYDYIGSPWLVKNWAINDFDFPESWRGQNVVGNGGFCIRSKKLLETSSRLFNAGKIVRAHPEDIAISVWYRDVFISEGIQFAPVELAKSFAIEGGDETYSNQFGFHGYYTDIEDWFKQNVDRLNLCDLYNSFKKNQQKTWSPKNSTFFNR